MVLSSIDLHYQYPVWFRYDGDYENRKPKLNYDVLTKAGLRGRAFYFAEVKPILRPLRDMKDEEAVECAKIIARRPPHFTAVENADITRYENSIDIVFIDKLDEVINIGNNGDALLYRHVDMSHRIIEQRCNNQADYFTYLLSKHFDLFDLIESGLAIDATTLKPKDK